MLSFKESPRKPLRRSPSVSQSMRRHSGRGAPSPNLHPFLLLIPLMKSTHLTHSDRVNHRHGKREREKEREKIGTRWKSAGLNRSFPPQRGSFTLDYYTFVQGILNCGPTRGSPWLPGVRLSRIIILFSLHIAIIISIQ